MLTKGLRPTYCSDIYAFGCVWLEVSRCRPLDSNKLITFSIQLCTGSPPFADLKSDLQVISRIMTGSCPTYPLLQNPPYNASLPFERWTFISQCWEHNPTMRPSSAQLVCLCVAAARCVDDTRPLEHARIPTPQPQLIVPRQEVHLPSCTATEIVTWSEQNTTDEENEGPEPLHPVSPLYDLNTYRASTNKPTRLLEAQPCLVCLL